MPLMHQVAGTLMRALEFTQTHTTHPSSAHRDTVIAPPAPPPSQCPPWCFKSFVRSWACDTAECEPCRDECERVKLPEQSSPRRNATAPRGSSVVRAGRGHGGGMPFLSTGMEHTWTCSPAAWPPRRMYVMFSMQRSASTTACGVINTLPDAFCAYELLAEGNRRYTDEDRKLMRADPAGFLRRQFRALVAGRATAPCAWGFKLFPEHAGAQHLPFLRWVSQHRCSK